MTTFHLDPLPGFHPFPGPVVLVIMDGVGLGRRDESDGVFLANTPVLDELLAEPLFVSLKAHGKAVGLPSDEDMGNSEVGHNALGAGRVFAQGAQLVNNAIASGSIFKGAAWQEAVSRGKAGGTVHFIGLLSDGNVHSHIEHLFALLDRCAEEGVARVRVHPLLDGRDVGERSALTYLDALEGRLAQLNGVAGRDYRIASGGGRMVTTMDRYGANWGVVERGWKAHVLGIGRHFASARQAVETYYREDPASTDQYLDSFVIESGGEPVGTIAGRRRGDLLQLPRRPRHRDLARLRGGGLPRVRPRPRARRLLRRHDAVRRRRADSEAVPRGAAGHRLDRVPVPVRGGRHVVRHLGNPEVRARHVLLERQQLRLHRREPRDDTSRFPPTG